MARKEVKYDTSINDKSLSIKERVSYIHDIFGKNEKINVQIFNKRESLKEIFDDIKVYTKFLGESASISNMIYCINNDISDNPLCACGVNHLKFIDYKNGYRTFCGDVKECSANAKQSLLNIKNKMDSLSTEDKSKITEKQKQTNIERYGVDNFFKNKQFIESNFTDEINEKRIINREIANKKRYGVKNVFELKTIKDKIKTSNIEKYGVDNYMKTLLSEDSLKVLECPIKLKELLDIHSVYYIAKEILKCDSTTVFSYIAKHDIDYIRRNVSVEEAKIENILIENNIEYIKSDKSVLKNNKHLDFYIPKFNFAIECNGLYWHSEKIRREKDYHQEKYEICEKNGVRLIQFWDCEINDKYDVVKSMILNNLNIVDSRVYARKTKFELISNNDASSFICSNHLQDLKSNNIHLAYGLFLNSDLVSVMSFSKSGNKVILNRFCNKRGYSVVGAFTKLLKNAIKLNDFHEVISYSDDRYSAGDVYKINNFKHTSYSDITYYYTNNFKELFHKSNFMKSKAKKLFENYSMELTESQNMYINGYTRVFGCKIKTWKLLTE